MEGYEILLSIVNKLRQSIAFGAIIFEYPSIVTDQSINCLNKIC